MQINDACTLFVKFIWYNMHKVKSHHPAVVVRIYCSNINYVNFEYGV